MDIVSINKRIISGFFTLTFRRAMLYAIRFITINLVLARILDPATIGIFNIANAILSLFSYFSDIGLAAAIIQKKNVTNEDLKTTFTIQETLALLILVIIFIFAPRLAEFYKLDTSGMWLIRILGIGFFFSSLKVIPAVLLERKLKFAPLVFVEIIETTIFCSMLIYLSFSNYGLYAFTYASIFQSISGTVLMYLIAPWKIAIGLSRNSIRPLINFGLPFQLNSLLALLKDRLVPLVIAKMVGSLGVGYITWAQSWAFMPLEIMNIMTRITFPAFARLQDNKVALKATLEKSIFFTALLFYPLLFGLLAIAPSLIEHVVSNKWKPALPLIYLFSVTAFWATLSTPFTNFLSAIGKIKVTLSLMAMWTVLEWALSPVLTLFYGYYGVAIASCLIAFTSFLPILIIRKIIKFEIIKNIYRQLISAFLMALIVFYFAQNYIYDLLTFTLVVLLGGCIYFLLIILILKENLIENFKSLTQSPK